MRPLFLFLLAALMMPASLVKAQAPLSAQGLPSPVAAHIERLLVPEGNATALAATPAVRAFYQRRAYAPAWGAGPQPSAQGRAALALLAQAEDYGLQPRDYHVAALQALADSLARPDASAAQAARQARFELQLTDGLLQFALHLRRGRLRPFTPSPLEKKAGVFEPAAWLTKALAAPNFTAALLRCQPANREYQQLQQALAAWRRRPVGLDSLLHRRRARQMAVTLERWRWAPIADSRYVLVNLPAYRLEAVAKGRVQQAQRVVVGRPACPTPTLSSRLTSFTVAPEWRVPTRIATQQILPYLQANARASSETDFLADNNYTLYDAQGRPVDPATVNWLAVTAQNFPYSIRQNPGCGNLLGNFIFPFANPYGLYLNDGPDPQRFTRRYRALGHSCLQVQHPVQLAAYLLGPDAVRTKLPSETECEAMPTPRHVQLRRPVALHVRYATCVVVAGRLRFYADVYGQDQAIYRQLFGPAPAVARAR